MFFTRSSPPPVSTRPAVRRPVFLAAPFLNRTVSGHFVFSSVAPFPVIQNEIRHQTNAERNANTAISASPAP